ncbi:type VI secretion system lipoprotein TssJ [Pseudomonas vranovensis]|uniref:type VI secretion system lipoprotein TssJ n=1 Tax=Pseudomonas vranovensis TaxID=321661 RepID=UPI000568A64E|nr:type VI secretion system lipoprotein TssJ [Pseudomonas vranovensis]
MRASRRRIAVCAVVLTPLLLQGCQMFGRQQTPSPPDPHKTVRMEAALDVNPNLYGRPSPVLLTVYQLSEAQAFLNADLLQLVSVVQAPSTLWLARTTFQLVPGEQRTHRFLPDPALRLMAVVAEYRDLDNAQWRAVEVFNAQRSLTLKVAVARSAVSISVVPEQQGASTNVQ